VGYCRPSLLDIHEQCPAFLLELAIVSVTNCPACQINDDSGLECSARARARTWSPLLTPAAPAGSTPKSW
jgi:hypothetical protein